MLSPKACSILKLLINNNKTPLTVKTISAMLDMSERSAHTYLKEVNTFCRDNQIICVSKRGVGVYLDLSEAGQELLKNRIQRKGREYDEKYRFLYILRTLLTGWGSYTVTLFSEELYVPRSTILRDLEQVETWAEAYELKLEKRGRSGLSLIGRELSLRAAIAEVNRLSQTDQSGAQSSGQKGRDYRLQAENQQRMEGQYGSGRMNRICSGLREFERLIEADMTDYSYSMMVEYLCIQQLRIRQGNSLTDQEADSLSVGFIPDPVRLFIQILENQTKSVLPDNEKQYAALLLAGAEFQKAGQNLAMQDYLLTKEVLHAVCGRMIGYVSEAAGLKLQEDFVLRESMERFIKHSLVRTKFRLAITNPFLNEVKKTYASVFTICYSLGNQYKGYAGIFPSEHEIAYLALLVGGAMVRVNKQVRAAFVGAGGLFGARLAAERIERLVPDIQIIGVFSTDEIRCAPKVECDILITTLSDFQHRIPVVPVTPLIGDRDVINLRRAVSGLFTKKPIPANHPVLNSYMKPELILLDEEPDTKQVLIRRACTLLEQRGHVNREYYSEVIHREAVSSTEINYGVAIPHGIENHVINPAVVLIRLKQKIDWGNGPVDLIFLLALNFDDIVVTRRFFKLFYEKVGNPELVEQLRKAASKEMILELLQ